MNTEKRTLQVGWTFKGVDIVSPGYSKVHYFPSDVYGNRQERTLGYGSDHNNDAERMFDVSCDVGDRYDFEHNDSRMDRRGRPWIKERQFEVAVIERLDGKIIKTTIAKAQPKMEVFTVPLDDIQIWLEDAERMAARWTEAIQTDGDSDTREQYRRLVFRLSKWGCQAPTTYPDGEAIVLD